MKLHMAMQSLLFKPTTQACMETVVSAVVGFREPAQFLITAGQTTRHYSQQSPQPQHLAVRKTLSVHPIQKQNSMTACSLLVIASNWPHGTVDLAIPHFWVDHRTESPLRALIYKARVYAYYSAVPLCYKHESHHWGQSYHSPRGSQRWLENGYSQLQKRSQVPSTCFSAAVLGCQTSQLALAQINNFVKWKVQLASYAYLGDQCFCSFIRLV